MFLRMTTCLIIRSSLNWLTEYEYECIKGSETDPRALINKQFLQKYMINTQRNRFEDIQFSKMNITIRKEMVSVVEAVAHALVQSPS